MSDVPVGDHALLSDCRSVALLTSDGSVDWLCWPRIDSPAVFGRLLDPDAGHFRIAPAEANSITRWRYRAPGLVLETCWVGQEGELEVVDALAHWAPTSGDTISAGTLLVCCCAEYGALRVSCGLPWSSCLGLSSAWSIPC